MGKKKKKVMRILAKIKESDLNDICGGCFESQVPKANTVEVIGEVKEFLKDGVLVVDFANFAGDVKIHSSNLDIILDCCN